MRGGSCPWAGSGPGRPPPLPAGSGLRMVPRAGSRPYGRGTGPLGRAASGAPYPRGVRDRPATADRPRAAVPAGPARPAGGAGRPRPAPNFLVSLRRARPRRVRRLRARALCAASGAGRHCATPTAVTVGRWGELNVFACPELGHPHRWSIQWLVAPLEDEARAQRRCPRALAVAATAVRTGRARESRPPGRRSPRGVGRWVRVRSRRRPPGRWRRPSASGAGPATAGSARTCRWR